MVIQSTLHKPTRLGVTGLGHIRLILPNLSNVIRFNTYQKDPGLSHTKCKYNLFWDVGLQSAKKVLSPQSIC